VAAAAGRGEHGRATRWQGALAGAGGVEGGVAVRRGEWGGRRRVVMTSERGRRVLAFVHPAAMGRPNAEAHRGASAASRGGLAAVPPRPAVRPTGAYMLSRSPVEARPVSSQSTSSANARRRKTVARRTGPLPRVGPSVPVAKPHRTASWHDLSRPRARRGPLRRAGRLGALQARGHGVQQ
jgi:hypothetical protein